MSLLPSVTFVPFGVLAESVDALDVIGDLFSP